MSIELTNIFLLIHDDIIDRDDFRHGVQTIHKRYEKLARRFYKQTDAVHFGDSMALVVGDMAAAAGNEIIFNSRFSPERILEGARQAPRYCFRHRGRRADGCCS